MKTLLHRYRNFYQELLKRSVFTDMENPNIATSQERQEEESLVDKIVGNEREQNAGPVKRDIDGKIKKTVDEVNALQNKFGSLGTNVKQKLDGFLLKKLQEYKSRFENSIDVNTRAFASLVPNRIDTTSGETAETVFERFAEFLSGRLNESLREFDRGLDKVMLRVNMRKEMATKLNDFGDSFTPDEKNQMGTALEDQLSKIEGNIDGTTEIGPDQIKERLAILKEITKYGDMMKVLKEKGGNSIDKAQLIPEHSIAYPPTPQNGFTFFKYWTQEVGGHQVLRCIDNNGSIQQLDPFQSEAFGKAPWKVLYNGFTRQRSASFEATTTTEMINRSKPNVNQLTQAQREQMLKNAAVTFTYVDPEDLNFTGLPSAERQRLQAVLPREYDRLKTEQRAAYTRTPGEKSSVEPAIQTYAYVNSTAFGNTINAMSGDSTRLSTFVHGLTHNSTGTERASTATATTGPSTQVSSRPASNPERAREAEIQKALSFTANDQPIAVETDKPVTRDVVLGRIDTTTTAQRRFTNEEGDPLDYLEVVGNEVKLKKETNIPLTYGENTIYIEARTIGSSGEWTRQELVITNENPEESLQEMRDKETKLSIGSLEANVDHKLYTYEDLPAGYELSEVNAFYKSLNASSRGELLNKNSITIDKNSVSIKHDILIMVGSHLSIDVRVKDAAGEEHDITLKVEVGAAEALNNEEVSLEGGTFENGYSHKEIETGPISAMTTAQEIPGVKINNPKNASLSLLNAQQLSFSQSGPFPVPTFNNNYADHFEIGTEGQVKLKANKDLPLGKYFLEIKSDFHGATNENHKISFEVKDKPVAASAPPSVPSQASGSPTETPQQQQNLALWRELREQWDNNDKFKMIQDHLEGFSRGKYSIFTLGSIDAKNGRFFVNNDNNTTLLSVDGNRIVIEAGQPGETTKMVFRGDEKDKAIAVAVAMNKLTYDTIEGLSLKTINDFDSDGRSGNFFEYDGGTLQVNDNTGIHDYTDTNLWAMPEGMRSKQEDIIKLMNAKFRDLMGDANGNGKREYSDTSHIASLESNLDPNTQKVFQGQPFEFNIQGMSKDYIYSYSGNRMNWTELPEAEGNKDISIPYSQVDSGEKRIIKDGKEYMRVTIIAAPRNPQTNSNRPKVIEKDIQIIPLYEPGRVDEKTFTAVSNKLGTNHKRYTLRQEIESGDSSRPYTNDVLTIQENKNSAGDLVIQKNGQDFATLNIDSEGNPHVTYIDSSQATLFQVKWSNTTGRDGKLEFSVKK